MAPAKASATQDAPERSRSIDVTSLPSGNALAAAWRGIAQFFGGQFENVTVVPPSEDNEDGGVTFTGFSVDGAFDPAQIVRDLGTANRRVPFASTYAYLIDRVDTAPWDKDDKQGIQNWLSSFMKGSEDDGTTKTPAYARKAVAEYKATIGMPNRRGARKKILRLDDVQGENADAILSQLDPQYLDALLAGAQRVREARQNQATATVTSNGNENGSEDSSQS